MGRHAEPHPILRRLLPIHQHPRPAYRCRQSQPQLASGTPACPAGPCKSIFAERTQRPKISTLEPTRSRNQFQPNEPKRARRPCRKSAKRTRANACRIPESIFAEQTRASTPRPGHPRAPNKKICGSNPRATPSQLEIRGTNPSRRNSPNPAIPHPPPVLS